MNNSILEDNTNLINSFENLKVLIVGDIMIDSYLYGKVERISPEAPVPIVLVSKRENRLGGAANVARNIKSLGAEPFLCSVIGTDKKGDEFLELLQKEKMSHEGLIRSKDRITTTKFRVIGNKVQMLRVDEEVIDEITEKEAEDIEKKFTELIKTKKIDVVIFQDYDKGVITSRIAGKFIEIAHSSGIPVSVDPKRKHFTDFRNADLFKPNLKELKEGLNIEFDHKKDGELERAVEKLRNIMGNRIIMVTMSEDGVFTSFSENEQVKSGIIPSHVRSVSDVSGAGDTVISVASLCLALKIDPLRMATISNIAGGLVCEEAGVVPVNKNLLIKKVKLFEKNGEL